MTKLIAACGLVLVCLTAVAQTPAFVAGVHSDRRPDNAPQLTQHALSPEQLAHALRGVEGAAPGNLASVAGTGAWWVPLRHRGMPPPYDPRGLHSGAAPLAASTAPAASAAR